MIKKLLILCLIMSLIIIYSCSKTGIQGDWKAKITILKGTVQVIKDGNTLPAKVNMILQKNDEIKTAKGTVDLKIAGLGVFKLKKYTHLKLIELAKKNHLKLKNGKILLALDKLKKDTTFNVETPTAVAGIRGTSFLVSTEGESTKVGVLTGKVEVRSFDGFVAVNELREVRVSGKDLDKVSIMKRSTITDVKSILKIKDVESIQEYKQIRANVKKLEIIEAEENPDNIDIDALKDAIKAKELQDDGSGTTEAMKDKKSGVKSSTIDSAKKKFIDDNEF